MSGTVLTALSAPRPQAPSVARRTATLLPDGAAVVVVANRAFGCPIFTDQITTRGWDWVVRVQRQTRWKDHHGHVQPLRQQVRAAGERWKGQGQLFKDAGWRRVSALVLWGRAHREPLLLASSLPLQWELFAIYKQRAAIKTLFRGWKTSGWQWEASQVTDLEHHERLLLGLAFASLITLMQCTQAAAQKRQTPAHGSQRRSWAGAHSLLRLGRDAFWQRLRRNDRTPIRWALEGFDSPI